MIDRLAARSVIMPITAGIGMVTLPALAVTFLLVQAGCCAGGRHYEVSSEKFLSLANLPLGSAHDSRYIGATEYRAYLGVWSALPTSIGGGNHVYSVALGELPAEIAGETCTCKAVRERWPAPATIHNARGRDPNPDENDCCEVPANACTHGS
ncbi:MAG: hypothetical protein L0Z55_13195 [Planctomycetes bacterium]|nr:hypothetical protein [Planctomycetota bacterium]